MNVYRRGFRVPTGNLLEEFGIGGSANEKPESALAFWTEQVKVSILFPYYFLRKVFLRIKHNQLDEFSISRFEVRNY